MKKSLQIVGILALLAASTGALAEQYDGSSPLLCAVTQTMACDAVGDCIQGPAEAVNLPVFIKLDVQKKEVVTAREGGERRTSKILEVGTEGDALVFVGLDPGTGWSAAIDKATGRMTATAAVNGQGFIAFGSCLAL